MRISALQVVLSKPTPDARVEDGEFEENEAWALDIVLSTGEGKPKARHGPALLVSAPFACADECGWCSFTGCLSPKSAPTLPLLCQGAGA